MTIRVASYNLWNGAGETYFRLNDFAKEQKFDVLCLQEVNGWQDNDFTRAKDFVDRAGFTDWQYGNSNSEYKLATFTTLPVVSKTVIEEGFWHCVVELHVRFGEMELVIFNLDLDPWKEEPRLREVEKLLAKVDPNRPTILTGNFNSLSRADNYPPEFLAGLQRQGIYKFGQNTLEFQVTDRLAAAGFVDMGASMKRLDVTAPTPYREKTAEEPPARTDYMFVSGNLRPLVRDFMVLKNEATDKISDHYPIVLTLATSDDVQPSTVAAPPEAQPAPTTEPQPQNSVTEGGIKIPH